MLLYNFVLEVSLTFAKSQLDRRSMSELAFGWRLVLVSDVISIIRREDEECNSADSIHFQKSSKHLAGKTHNVVNLSNSRRNLTVSLR